MSKGKVWVDTHWWGFEIHLDHEAVKYYIKGRELIGEVIKPFLPEGIKEVVEVAVQAQTFWIESVAGDNGVKLVSPWASPAMLIPVREDESSEDFKLWWTTYAWDKDRGEWAWSKDHAFPDHMTRDTPAVAEGNGYVLCVHRGHEDDERLWSTFYDPDKGWSKDETLPDHRSDRGVALAWHDGKFYCAHRGTKGDSRLWWTTFDPATRQWSKDRTFPDHRSRTHPALSHHNGKLYCVHVGDTDDSLWYCTLDGDTWTKDEKLGNNAASANQPGLASYQGRLYCVHNGGSSDNLLFWCTFDGSTWGHDASIPGHESNSGVALTVCDGKLVAVHRGGGTDSHMWWLTYDGNSWSTDHKFDNHETAVNPAITVIRDKNAPSDRKEQILCVHRGRA